MVCIDHGVVLYHSGHFRSFLQGLQQQHAHHLLAEEQWHVAQRLRLYRHPRPQFLHWNETAFKSSKPTISVRSTVIARPPAREPS